MNAYKKENFIYFTDTPQVIILGQQCNIIKYNIEVEMLYAIRNLNNVNHPNIEEIEEKELIIKCKINNPNELQNIDTGIYEFFKKEYPEFLI